MNALRSFSSLVTAVRAVSFFKLIKRGTRIVAFVMLGGRFRFSLFLGLDGEESIWNRRRGYFPRWRPGQLWMSRLRHRRKLSEPLSDSRAVDILLQFNASGRVFVSPAPAP